MKPKRVGNRYRYTDHDLKLLTENVDTRSLEEKFSNLVNSVWFMLVQYSRELYGNEGEKKLKEIVSRTNIFFMNSTIFKE
ncbi:MAG: hypothetical protein PHF86_04005 [Candidatus Nanoarchaeia archaeon]|nr:hypothetical protein [Candidatus Nanoarchaeia archaeon]